MGNEGPYSIYAVRCKENGRIYVGCSKNVDSRLKGHFSQLENGEKTQRVGQNSRDATQWQKDYDKFGRDAFQCYLLERAISEDQKDIREAYWIRLYRTTDPRFGYNIKLPGFRKPGVPIEDGLPPVPCEMMDDQEGDA